jgi:nicotinamide riboside transporter PnuC
MGVFSRMNLPLPITIAEIAAAATGLGGGILLVYKRRLGWIFQSITMVLIAIINWYVGLYWLLLPTFFSLGVSVWGYFKWKPKSKFPQHNRYRYYTDDGIKLDRRKK